MEQILKEFVKPELLILIPVLYLIGAGLKVSKFKDNYIPIALGVVGIILSFIYISYHDWVFEIFKQLKITFI